MPTFKNLNELINSELGKKTGLQATAREMYAYELPTRPEWGTRFTQNQGLKDTLNMRSGGSA